MWQDTDTTFQSTGRSLDDSDIKFNWIFYIQEVAINSMFLIFWASNQFNKQPVICKQIQTSFQTVCPRFEPVDPLYKLGGAEFLSQARVSIK